MRSIRRKSILQRRMNKGRIPQGKQCLACLKNRKRPVWLEHGYIYSIRKKGGILWACIPSFTHHPSSKRYLKKDILIPNSVSLEFVSPICILFQCLTDTSNLTELQIYSSYSFSTLVNGATIQTVIQAQNLEVILSSLPSNNQSISKSRQLCLQYRNMTASLIS